MKKMKKLGDFEIDQIKEFDLGENILTGSAFLPTISDAKEHYTLNGNFKCALMYDPADTRDEFYQPISTGGKCDFSFTPEIVMGYLTNPVENAQFIYLLYPGLKTFTGETVDNKGWSQPIVNCSYTSLNNNFSPSMLETDRAEIIDRSGILPPKYSSYLLEGIHLKSPKLFTVMEDGELRSPTAINIAGVGGSFFSYRPDTEVTFYDAIENKNKTLSPVGSVGLTILRDVIVHVNYEEYNAATESYITRTGQLILDLYFNMQFKFNFYNYNLTLSELNNDLEIDIFSEGNQGLTINNLNVINYESKNTFTGVFYFSENGVGVYLKYVDGVREDYKFVPFLSPLNYQSVTGQLYGVFNFCGGVSVGSGISITRQSLEAVNPVGTGENLELYSLEGVKSDDEVFYAASYADHSTGFTAIVGNIEDGKNKVYFCLQDGKGFYELDLSAIVPEKGWVEYASYAGGVLTIGFYPNIEDYPDPLEDPPPLKYAILTFVPIAPPMKRIELDFRKMIISFIPCSTHCMAKGGIISKVY